MLEGNFNVTRVRAVPRPLNINILVPLKAMSIPFNVIYIILFLWMKMIYTKYRCTICSSLWDYWFNARKTWLLFSIYLLKYENNIMHACVTWLHHDRLSIYYVLSMWKFIVFSFGAIIEGTEKFYVNSFLKIKLVL